MKLYFKDLSYETKYKWLEWFMLCYFSSPKEVNALAKKHFEQGYIEINSFTGNDIKQIKDLNIWKEPRKFGRFWDNDKAGCVYGFLLLIDNDECDDYKYHFTNEYGCEQDYYKNFEEITDLKELQ